MIGIARRFLEILHSTLRTKVDLEKTYFSNDKLTYTITLTLNRWRCEMTSYDKLKAEMKVIQQQMIENKENERTNPLKKVKRLCKEFGFTAGMLKGSLAEGITKR